MCGWMGAARGGRRVEVIYFLKFFCLMFCVRYGIVMVWILQK
jgi:hypothetical protein